MGRILCIDYGQKRCGIAVTDKARIVPGGLTTVSTHSLFDFIKDYVAKEDVDEIVMGLPLQPNGLPSENHARVMQFGNRLKKELPEVNVNFYDERFTSVLAHQTMIAAGLGQKRRRDKALVDEVSACIILQDYMTSRNL